MEVNDNLKKLSVQFLPTSKQSTGERRLSEHYFIKSSKRDACKREIFDV